MDPLAATVQVYIGLGSNLDDPVRQIRQAFAELRASDSLIFVRRSKLYRSPPMGPRDQPNYVNAVALIETRLPPLDLLTILQDLERQHNRIRERHWGPRTLDLDLLLYGSQVIDEPGLQVPHPGLHERAFVLYPLMDVARDLEIPGHGTLLDLLARCPFDGLECIDEN